MLLRHLSLIGCAALIAGCGVFSSEPSVRVAIPDADRRYEPLDPVVFQVINTSGDTVFEDRCRGELQGHGAPPGQWTASYGVARFCGWQQPRMLKPIPPGTVTVDTFHINYYAYSGPWRVELWLYNAAGGLLPPEARTSNAIQAIGRHEPP